MAEKAKPATPKPVADEPVTPKATAELADIAAIVGGYHGAPFHVLGPHTGMVDGKECLVIRAFRPLDDRVYVVDVAKDKRTEMTRVHSGGFFEAAFPGRKKPFAYRLIVADATGTEFEMEDPYRFPMRLTDYDVYLHGEGNFL
jgi:1,4-alpha-glucan branching enzyme